MESETKDGNNNCPGDVEVHREGGQFGSTGERPRSTPAVGQGKDSGCEDDLQPAPATDNTGGRERDAVGDAEEADILSDLVNLVNWENGVPKYKLDKDGQPVPCYNTEEWGNWFEEDDRRVALTELPGGVRVSTVFLAFDHSFSTKPHLPILWETMIFGGPHDQYQERYTNKEQALAGHEEAVLLAKSGEVPLTGE